MGIQLELDGMPKRNPMLARFTDKQISESRRKIAAAETWIKAFSDAWAYMRNDAIKSVSCSEPLSMQGLMQNARLKGDSFTGTDGGRFGVSHNLRTSLAMFMQRDEPSTRGKFRMQDTCTRAVFLADYVYKDVTEDDRE